MHRCVSKILIVTDVFNVDVVALEVLFHIELSQQSDNSNVMSVENIPKLYKEIIYITIIV